MAESPSSTLSPTEEEGDNQGTHELELHYGGELDLHQHVFCDKNPGHADFIPVNSSNVCNLYKFNVVDHFNLEHFCSEAAILATKIKVYRVSSNRSKEKMKEKYNIDHYPLSAYAGKKRLGVGSGCVTGIDVKGHQGLLKCQLENCPHSKEPVYGYINITTAAHVVFDDEEAKETVVEFFDDDPKDKNNVEIAHGVKIIHRSVEGDFCEFMCVTHSQSLFDKISGQCSPSIPFKSFGINFYGGPQHSGDVAAMRIFRLLEFIKMSSRDLTGSSNLQAVLGCTLNGSMMLQRYFSEQSIRIRASSDKSVHTTVENFLNAAESMSGVSGLKDSVLRVIDQGDASFHREFLKELCTTINVETTVTRIALIGTMNMLTPGYYLTEASLNEEDIYQFFLIVLDAFRDTDWIPTRLVGDEFGLRLKAVFSGVKDVTVAINKWFGMVHSLLSSIKEMHDTILKYQLITKLSPKVTGNYWQIKDIILRMADYLDQVASTLNIHFGDVDNIASESYLSPKQAYYASIDDRSLDVTELWITHLVIPNDDDLLIALLGVRQKISDLIMKCAGVKNTVSIPYKDISAESIWKTLVGTGEIFRGVQMCLNQSEDVFESEVKRCILSARRYLFQQHSDYSLLIHISHPHGQSKQVTFGEHISCNADTGHYEHIYTVPTCMGCSGGPVWILPKREDGRILWDQIYAVPHSGCHDRVNKLNHSSSWTFSLLSVGQEKDKFNPLVPKQHSFEHLSVPSQTGSSAAETSEEKRWLLYLLRSVDCQLLSGLSVKDAIDKKKLYGAGQRVSDDDDVEALLIKACQFEWL